MDDEVRRWLAEIAGEAPPSEPDGGPPDAAADHRSATGGRLRRLLLLAGLPWALLGAVLAVTALRAGDATPAPAPQLPPGPHRPGAPTTATPPPDRPIGRAPARTTAAAGSPAGAARAATHRRAAAGGALAVRLAVTDGRRRYVDTVAAEAVEAVAGVTIVTVRAVVLHGRGGRWHTARAGRYAVPVSAGGRALGPPWALPPPPPAAQPTWRRVVGLRGPAAAALRDAGYRRVRVLRVARDHALAGVLTVRLRARAPGEGGRRRHEVWLRDGPAPSVLGHGTDRRAPTAGGQG